MSDSLLQEFIRLTLGKAKYGSYEDPTDPGKFKPILIKKRNGDWQFEPKFNKFLARVRKKMGRDDTYGTMVGKIEVDANMVLNEINGEGREARRAYKRKQAQMPRPAQQGESKKADKGDQAASYDAQAVEEESVSQVKKYKSKKQPTRKEEIEARMEIDTQETRLESPKKKLKPKAHFFSPASGKDTPGDILAREVYRGESVEEVYAQLALKYGTTVEQVMKDPRFLPDKVRQFVERNQKK